MPQAEGGGMEINMKEIGGYIEFEHYHRPMLYDDGIKLNCGRNALAYLIKAYDIQKIVMPKYMCDSCNNVLKKTKIRYYSINVDFKPIIETIGEDEWLYVVNFYGQLSYEYLLELKGKYNIIVDNAQAYFNSPIKGIPTLYTCRKFFGVADGAILYADKTIEVEKQDESFERMRFLMGRFERSASEFYYEYIENNHFFANEPIKRMSKLTENFLRGIDYEEIRKRRTENFAFLNGQLSSINKIYLNIPDGPFMYPLYLENGAEVRKALQRKKIFIPLLWPAVFNICKKNEVEFDMAENILPIPIDQRHGIEDMKYIVKEIRKCLD